MFARSGVPPHAEGTPDRCSRARRERRLHARAGRRRRRGGRGSGGPARRRSARPRDAQQQPFSRSPRSSCRAGGREHPLAEKRPVIVVAPPCGANDRCRGGVLPRGRGPHAEAEWRPPRLRAMAATQCERTIEHGLPAGEPVAIAGPPERDGDEAPVEQPDPPRLAGRHPSGSAGGLGEQATPGGRVQTAEYEECRPGRTVIDGERRGDQASPSDDIDPSRPTNDCVVDQCVVGPCVTVVTIGGERGQHRELAPFLWREIGGLSRRDRSPAQPADPRQGTPRARRAT